MVLSRPVSTGSFGAMDDALAVPLAREQMRARWTIYLLYAGLGADIIALASSLSRWVVLQQFAGGALPQQRVDEFTLQHGAIASLKLLTLIPTMIVWLFWEYRATANLRLVGTKRSAFTPGAAVGYWFIPFANLWLPYQITTDLWLRSDTGNVDEVRGGRRAPALFGWWWVMYIVAGVTDRAYYSLAENSSTAAQQLTATTSGILAAVVGIVASLLAIAVVRGIDKRQQAFPGLEAARPSDTPVV